MGLRVPQDVSLIGYDNVRNARYFTPALTTIHQPMAELARTATQILIAGGDITHKRLPHDLVERASVAPPKRN